MSAKVILMLCAQALFVQLAFSSCIGRPNWGAGLPSCGLSTPITPGLGVSGCAGPILPTPGCSDVAPNGVVFGNSGIGYGPGLGYNSNLVISTSGGALPITSTSSIAPTGLSIVSENVFEGTLYVTGELPFVSAVAVEGVVPSGGAGAVNHSYGNGVTAIESITPSAAAAVVPAGAAIGPLGAGVGAFGAGLVPLSLLNGIGCNVPEIVTPICGC